MLIVIGSGAGGAACCPFRRRKLGKDVLGGDAPDDALAACPVHTAHPFKKPCAKRPESFRLAGSGFYGRSYAGQADISRR